MKIFELHFNPRQKNESPDIIFDSFCYEPKNAYERKLGGLYMAGLLKNILPKNIQFISNVVQVLKNKFYAPAHKSQRSAFESCLEGANEFLAQELSVENISWLGNLSFAALSLTSQNKLTAKQLTETPYKQQWTMHFTKVGQIKALLIRNHTITDITKEFETETIEPYPLKVFTKTIVGKIAFGDKIIILTKEIFDFFSGQTQSKTTKKEGTLLNLLAKSPRLEEETIRTILKPFQNEISELSGTLLLIDTEKDPLESPSIFNFQTELEKFSIKEIFKPVIEKTLLKIKALTTQKPINVKKYKIKTPKSGFLTLGNTAQIPTFLGLMQKRFVLILIFIFLIFIGFLIFQQEEKKLSQKSNELLSALEEKISEAESFLGFQNEQRANTLFREALLDIEPLTQDKYIKVKAINAKELILQNLYKINKVEIVSEQHIFLEINEKEFSPQKSIYLSGNLYLFSSSSPILRTINLLSKEQSDIPFPETQKGADGAVPLDDNSIIFLKNNNASLFSQKTFSDQFEISFLNGEAISTDISSYQRNLYIIQNSHIVKYSPPIINNKDNPQNWILSSTKQLQDAKAMSIDSSIWIISQDREIGRYYNGTFQENISIDIFPETEKFSDIFTNFNLPYLYILEPSQNRIIVTDKTGQLLKQFKLGNSENIRDFAVSGDGKTIYILTGQHIYKTQLD